MVTLSVLELCTLMRTPVAAARCALRVWESMASHLEGLYDDEVAGGAAELEVHGLGGLPGVPGAAQPERGRGDRLRTGGPGDDGVAVDVGRRADGEDDGHAACLDDNRSRAGEEHAEEAPAGQSRALDAADLGLQGLVEREHALGAGVDLLALEADDEDPAGLVGEEHLAVARTAHQGHALAGERPGELAEQARALVGEVDVALVGDHAALLGEDGGVLGEG